MFETIICKIKKNHNPEVIRHESHEIGETLVYHCENCDQLSTKRFK